MLVHGIVVEVVYRFSQVLRIENLYGLGCVSFGKSTKVDGGNWKA